MATQIVLDNVSDPDEPGASGRNFTMRSPSDASTRTASTQPPPSKKSRHEEAVDRLARLREKRRKLAVWCCELRKSHKGGRHNVIHEG